ncbi:MAG: uracil-DNA glycosylase [Verrucomicrobiia bacterium]
MNDSYKNILDSAIGYIQELKARGVKYFYVESETLENISKPMPPRRERKQTGLPEEVVDKKIKPVVSVESALNQLWAKPELTPEQKTVALSALKEKVLKCKKCPNLVSFRTHIVFGVGNSNASIMFVGEAPGADEDLQGEPFVGKAGQLLTKIITAMGLTRQQVYIANILKCRPDTPLPTGNRAPTADEMRVCIPYLIEQIDIIRPKVIVALGATAVEGLLGERLGITKVRGNWKEYRGIPVMPTYHPAYLLRNQSLAVKREVWYDMLKVMEKLGIPISERQRNYFTKSSENKI